MRNWWLGCAIRRRLSHRGVVNSFVRFTIDFGVKNGCERVGDSVLRVIGNSLVLTHLLLSFLCMGKAVITSIVPRASSLPRCVI